MAAPLVQRVTLDSAAALRELAQLERSLATLNNPINVPVDIDVDGTQRAEREMQGLRQEVDQTGDEFTQMGRRADQSTDAILRVGSRGASAFTSLRGSIIGVGAALAAIQGVRILGAFAAGAIQSASNLEESLSKTNVVFEQFSGDIQKFARDAPKALGLSTAAALEATSTFGNLFVALGLSQEAAADLSPDIVQLAADLASFNNIAVDEAVEKLRSGLVGEVEPLRTLGVNLNAALVEAKALELGLTDSAGAVTEAGKVQARYALILEQTTTAQGDFARTSDGIANTQRTLQAEWENASTAIGEALIPAYEALLELIPTVIAAFEDLAPVIAAASQSFADGVPAADGFADFIQTLAAVPDALGFLKEGTDVVRDFTLGLAAVGTGQFGVGFHQIGEGIDSISTAIDGVNIDMLRNGLVNALQAGVDPATALANALAELTRLGLDDTQINEQAAALTKIAGVDTLGIKRVRDFLLAQGVAAGISAPQVETLSTALLTLFREAEVFSPEAFRLPGAEPQDVIAITDTAAAIRDLSLAGQSLEDFFPDLGAEGFTEPIDAMANALDAAKQSLEDDEGEIITDLSTFFDDLNAELSAQVEFQRNLAILRDRGLDLLADLFEGLGPGQGAGLLADAVTDPAAAAAEEQRLADHATAMAAAEFAAFDTELKQLIAGYDSMPVTIPLTFGGLSEIPIVALTAGGVNAATGEVSTNITVNQTFTTEPQPTTQTTRAAQEVNSIIAGQRGAQ